MLTTPSIRQVRTSRPDLYAFRIAGEVSRDDMEAMSELMNDAFDAHDDKVDMLLIFDRYEGSETGTTLSWEAIKSRFKSVTNVHRYVVVGAPDSAAEMIETWGSILPVEAETYSEEAIAWKTLEAEALAA